MDYGFKFSVIMPIYNTEEYLEEAIESIVNQDIAIYSILFNRLSYVNATKNASNLYSLINELNSYKKQMKKRY